MQKRYNIFSILKWPTSKLPSGKVSSVEISWDIFAVLQGLNCNRINICFWVDPFLQGWIKSHINLYLHTRVIYLWGQVEWCIENLSSNILPQILAVTNIGKYIFFSHVNFTMKGSPHIFLFSRFFIIEVFTLFIQKYWWQNVGSFLY